MLTKLSLFKNIIKMCFLFSFCFCLGTPTLAKQMSDTKLTKSLYADTQGPTGRGKLLVVDQDDISYFYDDNLYKYFMEYYYDNVSPKDKIYFRLIDTFQSMRKKISKPGPTSFYLTMIDEAQNTTDVEIPLYVKGKNDVVTVTGGYLLKGENFSIPQDTFTGTPIEDYINKRANIEGYYRVGDTLIGVPDSKLDIKLAYNDIPLFPEQGTYSFSYTCTFYGSSTAKVSPKMTVTPPTGTVPILNGLFTTIADSKGNITQNKIDPKYLKDLIVLRYYGNHLDRDIDIVENTGNSYKWSGNTPVTLNPSDKLIIGQMGYYQRKFIKLAMTLKNETPLTLNPIDDSQNGISFDNPSSVHFDFEILDGNNQPIQNRNLNVLFSIIKGRPAKGTTFSTSNLSLKNIIFNSPAVFDFANIQGTNFSDKYTMNFIKDESNTFSFSYLYGNLNSSFSLNVQNIASIAFFQYIVPIPIPVESFPSQIVGNVDNDGMLRAYLKKFVYKQEDVEKYEDVTFIADLSEYTIPLNKTNLTITSNYSNAITDSKIDFLSSSSGRQQLRIMVQKNIWEKWVYSFLMGIFTPFNLKIPVDMTNKNLLKVYNAETQNFEIPLKLYNENMTLVDDQLALMKMKPPTGEAIAQSVNKGSSTNDLDPKSLVKNLKSMLPFDTVEVIGFKEEKIFNKMGDSTAEVLVKSKETGVESTISVPVMVYEAPLAYVTVSEKIELKKIGDKFVEGIGTVSYTGESDVNILVDTANQVTLTNTSTDKVNLEIYKNDNTLLKENEHLTILNKDNISYNFSLKSPKNNFKKVDIYKGEMLINFKLFKL
ncbi:MAG: hypothetical protein LBM95_10015 [Lactobacillales bacterium]|jgi:hypothetical protein|nr:hypothetical protein [Lactobacillales bacterium]